MGGDCLDAQGIVEMLLDPGENGDEIRRADAAWAGSCGGYRMGE
ncbi:MAG: hypothetical protein V4477_05825 [Pseudomonadota bacterium]